ncbi:MAG TPA: DUF2520 domain-containing protein [Acidimicrobiales bacterium]|nr:DUF2520 domain-containing protein [Acidimicrobiales bacterium]
MTTFRLVGPGRAGRSLASALVDTGFDLRGVLGRGDDLSAAAAGVDLVILATPDGAVPEVAAAIGPVASTVVLHMSGALGLDVLAPHERVASVHPLVPLPSAEVGRVRLRSGITFAVAGDAMAGTVGRALGGRCVEIDEDQRAAYHAAACIASNHVVALLGQVERVAATAGLGLDAFVSLAAAAVRDVADLGAAAALTGPAARGDEVTVARHRAVLAPEELAGYDAGVALARRLAQTEMAPCA